MKVFFRRIHLYLSLAAGLVILVACLTGAILVFEKDLQMTLNKERYYVEAGSSKLSPDELVRKVKTAFPEAKVNGIKLYEDSRRSAEVSVVVPPKKNKKEETSKAKEEKKGPPQRQPGLTVFINPFTGQILEKYNYRETAFYTVFALHRWLLGGEGSVGKYIVGVSTFIFLFILITGIILWWPKTRSILRQRLRIKWSGGWKRINHDMHIVFGFYSAIFLFIIALTGLAWSFEWFNNSIYTVTKSPLKPMPPPTSTYVAGVKRISIDSALSGAKTIYPEAEFYNINFPKDSVEAFTVNALANNAVHENATDAVYIDQYSATVLGQTPYATRSLGARVRSTFKPVHTGSIWGWPTKIIAFIVCLFGVSFPITGTLMWINRTGKNAKTQKRSIRNRNSYDKVS